jgi:hypothetical protein
MTFPQTEAVYIPNTYLPRSGLTSPFQSKGQAQMQEDLTPDPDALEVLKVPAITSMLGSYVGSTRKLAVGTSATTT